MTIPSPPRLALAAALTAGCAAWMYYLQQDLVLSHYDAKAHLVVARRVIDNMTPGWKQVGAVWLPLPHLIQLLPTQIDAFYRSGAFGSLLSIASFAATAWASARLVLALTGSAAGALTAAVLLLLNPNLLYLQATPMTEPLLLGVTFIAVLWLHDWLTAASDNPARRPPARLGWILFAAAWTRYEAWPILAAALGAAIFALWRRGTARHALVRQAAALTAWPAAAVVIFLVNSRITSGSWFITGGFYVPDPAYENEAVRSIVAVWWGTHRLSGYVVEIAALSAAAIVLVRGLRRPAAAADLVPIALFAAAALPVYAFYQGHPFRIRYMIPMAAACALFGGVAVGVVARALERRGVTARPAALLAALLIAASVVESPPFNAAAPMLEEAQWDRPRSRQRRAVSACLAGSYRGEKVMASMGSLAHYMQELARDGFGIADFLHEGNGVIWEQAMETGPALHAGWMLVEEEAEGGDVLAQRLRGDATFARGMARVCEGGGVALYRRTPVQ